MRFSNLNLNKDRDKDQDKTNTFDILKLSRVSGHVNITHSTKSLSADNLYQYREMTIRYLLRLSRLVETFKTPLDFQDPFRLSRPVKTFKIRLDFQDSLIILGRQGF
jgi:hypothetical protein